MRFYRLHFGESPAYEDKDFNVALVGRTIFFERISEKLTGLVHSLIGKIKLKIWEFRRECESLQPSASGRSKKDSMRYMTFLRCFKTAPVRIFFIISLM